MSGCVVKMGPRGSNRSWTVEQMLEDSLEDVRSGARTANKCLVIFLDTEGTEDYTTGFAMAQLSASEAIALMRAQEAKLLKMMHII